MGLVYGHLMLPLHDLESESEPLVHLEQKPAEWKVWGLVETKSGQN